MIFSDQFLETHSVIFCCTVKMCLRIIVITLLFLSKVHAQSSCGIAGKVTSLIVNGKESNRGAWPWIVAVYNIIDDRFICGGTLVATNAVITVSSNWFFA